MIDLQTARLHAAFGVLLVIGPVRRRAGSMRGAPGRLALGVGLAAAQAAFALTFRGPRPRFWQRMTLTGLSLGSYALAVSPPARRVRIGAREVALGTGLGVGPVRDLPGGRPVRPALRARRRGADPRHLRAADARPASRDRRTAGGGHRSGRGALLAGHGAGGVHALAGPMAWRGGRRGRLRRRARGDRQFHPVRRRRASPGRTGPHSTPRACRWAR